MNPTPIKQELSFRGAGSRPKGRGSEESAFGFLGAPPLVFRGGIFVGCGFSRDMLLERLGALAHEHHQIET